MTDSLASALVQAFDEMDPEDFAVLGRAPLGVSLDVRQRAFEVMVQLRTESTGFAKAFPPQDLEAFKPKVSGFASPNSPLEAHKRDQAGVERVVAKVMDGNSAGRLRGLPQALIPELESLAATLSKITSQTRDIANLLSVYESVAFLAAPQDLLQPVAVQVHQGLKRARKRWSGGDEPEWYHQRPALPELIDAVVEYCALV
jgi:hypothetical protein